MNNVDRMLRRIRRSQRNNVFQKAAEIGLFEAELTRPGEVDQNLHDSIQTMNLASDDVHVPARVRIDLLQFTLQQLQMQNYSVDRILDFMRNSAGKPPAGGKTA